MGIPVSKINNWSFSLSNSNAACLRLQLFQNGLQQGPLDSLQYSLYFFAMCQHYNRTCCTYHIYSITLILPEMVTGFAFSSKVKWSLTFNVHLYFSFSKSNIVELLNSCVISMLLCTGLLLSCKDFENTILLGRSWLSSILFSLHFS